MKFRHDFLSKTVKISYWFAVHAHNGKELKMF